MARLPGRPQEPPGPAAGHVGRATPMLSAVAQAALEGDLAGKVQALASDPKDGLAAALARLGRAFMVRERLILPECSRCGETLPRVKSLYRQSAQDRPIEERKAH